MSDISAFIAVLYIFICIIIILHCLRKLAEDGETEIIKTDIINNRILNQKTEIIKINNICERLLLSKINNHINDNFYDIDTNINNKKNEINNFYRPKLLSAIDTIDDINHINNILDEYIEISKRNINRY